MIILVYSYRPTTEKENEIHWSKVPFFRDAHKKNQAIEIVYNGVSTQLSRNVFACIVEVIAYSREK